MDQLQSITISLPQLIAAIVVAIVGMIYGIQKIPKNYRENKVESSLLQMMHVELERLSTQNSILAKELGKLQLEVIQLNKQIGLLSSENQKLTDEVNNLNGELSRLQFLLSNGGENDVSKT